MTPRERARCGPGAARVPRKVPAGGRARALTGADSPGFWLRTLEVYYEPYADTELEEIVAACGAERERRARRPIRYPRWGTDDPVEVLARHAIDVSVVLSRRRRGVA